MSQFTRDLSAVILTVFIVIAVNCGGGNAERITPPIGTGSGIVIAPPPVQEKSPLEQKIDSIKKQLESVDSKVEVASKKGDKVEQLTNEKDALTLKKQLAEAYAAEWKGNAVAYGAQEKEKEQELATAKLDAWKVKLWWMAGICGFASIIAAGIAWGMPLLRPVATRASVILGAIAGLMLIVAECLTTIAWLLSFIPYVLAFAGLIVLGYIIVGLRHWWKDHHGLNQVIKAIEPVKGQITNFSGHMVSQLDDAVITHVDKYRKELGFKITKPAAPSPEVPAIPSDTPSIS